MGHTSRVTTALLAAVCALLVATAPVAADHTILLASQHTTDTDFNNAATLDDVTVSGSGTGASVELATVSSLTIDSFEDQNLDEYQGSVSNWGTQIGLTPDPDGDYYLRPDVDDPGPIISTSGLPHYYTAGDGNYSVGVELDGDKQAVVGFSASDLGNYTRIRINQSGVQVATIDDGSTTVRSDKSATTPTDEYVTVEVDVDSGPQNQMDATVTDAGGAELVTFSDVETVDPGDGIVFDANESLVRFDWARQTDIQALADDGTYVSQTHTVDNAAAAYTNLTLTNAEAVVSWEGSNGNGWTEVVRTTYTSTGNRSQTLAGNYENYRTIVTLHKEPGTTTAALHDEGVFATNHEPEISNLSPADGAAISAGDVTLEADVADANFDDGETVEVNFTVNGSVADTQTITSNQTVSTTVAVGGGSHTWSVAAEDRSHIVDTPTLSFGSPGTLYVHDGDAPATLLDDRTIEAEFVGTDTTSNFRTTRTTTNGTFPLGGLPAEQLRVRLNATGYAGRILIIDSPIEVQTRRTVMYNLSTASTFEQCFQLDSRGAGFAPDETQLVVQAYLDGQWENAGSKYFGAANLACFSLQDGEDYRLAVTDGQNTRNLGGYEADQSFANEVVVLLVEDITFGLDRGEDYRWQAQLTNESGSPEILFQLDSRDEPLEDLELTIWERGNQANELEALSTNGPVGVYSANFPLTPDQARQEWILNWTAEYPDGTIATGQTIVSLAGPAGTIIPDGIPSEVLLGLMVGLVILLGMVFSQLHAGVGMGITVAFAGLLVLLGVLPVSTEVLVLAMALAVVGYIGFGVFGR